jgi:hypothetical protein
MREKKWLKCTDPEEMLAYLQCNPMTGEPSPHEPSERKLRLFGCACCRRLGELLTADGRRAIETAERFADALATDAELQEAVAAAGADQTDAGAAVSWLGAASDAVEQAADEVAMIFSLTAGQESGADAEEAVHQAERRFQAGLLRHIIGNPFRPLPPLSGLPPTIRDLAESVYNQSREAVGPLHDALLEAGLSEWAAHFEKAGEWHPKGCWALDALTGRG